LFKGAGKKSNLSNYRFIHTKDENPKAFEHIVISKAKAKIVKGCSKFQIGAIPNHQSQEHLFTLKSVMYWYEKLKFPSSSNCTISANFLIEKTSKMALMHCTIVISMENCTDSFSN
jgi:hypothetical protein